MKTTKRIEKLERVANLCSPVGASSSVVIYRGNPCCADLSACVSAGHITVVRGAPNASVTIWLPDNGRDEIGD